MSYFFGFESQQERCLAYIPMLVRMKLDTSGVKLALAQWNRLPEHKRRQLFEQPCNNQLEAEVYRELLHELVLECCGETVRLLDVPSDLPWNNVVAVPDQLTERARIMGLEPPSLQQWKALTPAQRFTLLKLTRDGHESEHYVPAMREFDLA